MKKKVCPHCGERIDEPVRPNPMVQKVWRVEISFKIPSANEISYKEANEYFPILDVWTGDMHIDLIEFMKLIDTTFDDSDNHYSYVIFARNEQEAEEAKQMLIDKYNERMTDFISFIQHCMVHNAHFPEKRWR